MPSTLLGLIRASHGQEGVDRLLELSGIEHTPEYLGDVANWIWYEDANALVEAAVELTGDARVGRRIGATGPCTTRACATRWTPSSPSSSTRPSPTGTASCGRCSWNTSWSAWSLLRDELGLTTVEATAVMERAVTALLA